MTRTTGLAAPGLAHRRDARTEDVSVKRRAHRHPHQPPIRSVTWRAATSSPAGSTSSTTPAGTAPADGARPSTGAQYPALAGRSVDEAAAIAADAYHRDHNAVAAALLAAHRDRSSIADDAEIVVLLVAARPLVLMLDPSDRNHDSRAALWASVARRLRALEPDHVAASPVPLIPLLPSSRRGMALGGFVNEIATSSSRTLRSRPWAPATLRGCALLGARMREEQNEAEAGA